jgi:hypothetical protein
MSTKTNDYGDPCTCPADYEHTCPFREDVNDDSESLCNCCASCEAQCGLEI